MIYPPTITQSLDGAVEKATTALKYLLKTCDINASMYLMPDLLTRDLATQDGETALLLVLKMKRMNCREILPVCKILLESGIDYTLPVCRMTDRTHL